MSANDKPVIARLASCNIGKYFNLFSYFVISKINLQKYLKNIGHIALATVITSTYSVKHGSLIFQ